MQVSGYPSNTQAANVSRETTSKELLDVEGVPKEIFKEEFQVAYQKVYEKLKNKK